MSLNWYSCINNHILLPESSQDTSQYCWYLLCLETHKPSGFSKPIRLAKELADFVGAEEMARPQVILYLNGD